MSKNSLPFTFDGWKTGDTYVEMNYFLFLKKADDVQEAKMY